jgi:hypothetical protein
MKSKAVLGLLLLSVLLLAACGQVQDLTNLAQGLATAEPAVPEKPVEAAPPVEVPVTPPVEDPVEPPVEEPAAPVVEEVPPVVEELPAGPTVVETFEASLEQTEYDITDKLHAIHKQFEKFDDELSPVQLEGTAVTSETVREIGQRESRIKSESGDAKALIVAFKADRAGINELDLTSEGRQLLIKIEHAVDDYELRKDAVKACANKVEDYQEYVRVNREVDDLLDTWENQQNAILDFEEGEDYAGALDKVAEFQATNEQVTAKMQELSQLDVEDIGLDQIRFFNLHDSAYGHYAAYLQFMIDGDEESADEESLLFVQDASEAFIVGLFSINYNGAESWYRANIKVCLDYFEEY